MCVGPQHHSWASCVFAGHEYKKSNTVAQHAPSSASPNHLNCQALIKQQEEQAFANGSLQDGTSAQ